LRHKWLRSGRNHTGKPRRFPTLSRPHPGESHGGSVRVKRKRPSTKNRELGEESCLRWIDLRFQEERLESPIIGEVPEQQPPKSQGARTPSCLSGRAGERPVEAVKRRCPGEAQREDRRQRRGHRQRRQHPYLVNYYS